VSHLGVASDTPPAAGPRARPGLLRRWAPLALLAAASAVGVTVWAYRHRPTEGPPDRTSFLTNFQPLSLIDQTGRPFSLEGLRGKVVLFNFIFTSCPTVCPVQTQALAAVQQALPAGDRDRVHFVSVSVDPAHDTPAVLRAFGDQFKVDFSRWAFLTGAAADIDQLSDRLRLFGQNREKRPENHGTTLWLMDGQGRLMQRYAGDPPEVARLVSELDALVRFTR
jgi:protein SCO1/2